MIYFELLCFFFLLFNSDFWCYVGVVFVFFERFWIVKYVDKVLVGVYEIVVCECEVLNWSVIFRKKDKVFIVEIKECVC